MPPRLPLRWIAVSVFLLSSALNFLDRQLLAALAPEIKAEFQLSNEQYGYLIAAFSLTYTLSAPLMGLLIDRLGLNTGASLSVALWSLAGMATALATGFRGLLACRAALGLGEGGGIPGAGKANALYLEPGERALGAAFSQIGIALGSMAAPLMAVWFSLAYGWRWAFVAAGALGFLWIPLWLYTARRVPVRKPEPGEKHLPASALLRDPRLWSLIAANILGMTVYTLWMNWTTLYLTDAHGMTQEAANTRFAWIPPLFATLGGLAGGALSLRWSRRGMDLIVARRRVYLLSAVLLLSTALAPAMPSAAWATAVICLSFFSVVAGSVNVYALPIDLFGASRAGFAVATLTAAYGLMQALLSPLFGASIDRFGFSPVCVAVSVLPLAGCYFLRKTTSPA